MKAIFATLGLFLASQSLNAQVYLGENAMESNIETIVDAVSPGSVVVISEYHDNVTHHERQLQLIEKIAAAHPDTTVSVGMEFFYIDQAEHVAKYMAERLSETEFLEAIGWGAGFKYEWYRDIVLFPKRYEDGATIALNSPKKITRKVSRQGFDSLTEEELQWVPPHFEVGNEFYFERFSQVMGGGHIPPEKMDRYFAAQSLWDDTMAYSAAHYMQANPDHIFVIIIGDFHAAYGGGTPDRLSVRGVSNIVTISQIDVEGMSDSDINSQVEPHPTYGKRADFVWVSGKEAASL